MLRKTEIAVLLGMLLPQAADGRSPAKVFSLPESFYSCDQDDDCVEVDDGPCGCRGYGRRTAIHKRHGQEYRDLIDREFPMRACRGAESNDRSCRLDMEPRCSGLRCVLEPAPTGRLRSLRLTADMKKDCRTDAECVLVNEGCCGCPDGGRREPIAAVELGAYRAAAKQRCAGVHCRGLSSEHQSCEIGTSAYCYVRQGAESGTCYLRARAADTTGASQRKSRSPAPPKK